MPTGNEAMMQMGRIVVAPGLNPDVANEFAIAGRR